MKSILQKIIQIRAEKKSSQSELIELAIKKHLENKTKKPVLTTKEKLSAIRKLLKAQ